MALLTMTQRVDFAVGAVQCVQHALGVANHRLAIQRWDYATSMAFEQLNAKPVFQFLQKLRDGRLGNAQSNGSTIEVTGLAERS